MSRVVFSVGSLGSGPAVWTENGRLYAQTPLLARILRLFSFSTTLEVDPWTEHVHLERCYLWCFHRSRTLSFHEIERINYRYLGVPFRFGSFWWGRTERVETFYVDLVLKGSGEQIPLFRFRGRGSVGGGWLGVVLGDSAVDSSGDQDEASRQLIDLLCKHIGVGLGKPNPRLRDAAGHVKTCVQCGRAAAPRAQKCLYCGGALEATAERK